MSEAPCLNVEKFVEDLPHLYSSSNYWLIRANGGQFFTDFLMNNYVGIGFNEISLESIHNTGGLVEKIKQFVTSAYPQTNPNVSNGIEQMELLPIDNSEEDPSDASNKRNAGSIAGQLSRFVFSVKKNDIVVVPSTNGIMFAVGQVLDSPYELDDGQLAETMTDALDSDYEASNFAKRISVRWLGRFNRSDADARLYPMIYAQHTVSLVDQYAAYINRALFDAYVLDDEDIHLTYHITQESNVDAKPLGQFIYLYSQIFDELSTLNLDLPSLSLDSQGLIIKVNVQSKGPAEIVTKKTLTGALILLILSGVLAGGKFDISVLGGTFKFDTPGLIRTISDYQDAQHKRNIEDESEKSNQADQEEKVLQAYKLAKKLHAPVSSLGIDLPRQAEKVIQKQLDAESAENKKNPGNDDSPDSESSN